MTVERFNPYTRIGRPLEAHNAATIEAYEAVQAGIIAHNRAKRPALKWRDPFAADATGLAPLVSGGCWGVLCPGCGNFAVYDPDWKLALCLECGAQFRDVEPPADWEAIEQILVARAELVHRQWGVKHVLGHADARESLDDLRDENRAHGDPVPGEDA